MVLVKMFVLQYKCSIWLIIVFCIILRGKMTITIYLQLQHLFTTNNVYSIWMTIR